ncbi:MAG: ComEC/Rec2 family competence protein [Actinobacteria bacterium]|nr:ComEC/Rec2 family competence protein [Actinomycetota bacterium]
MSVRQASLAHSHIARFFMQNATVTAEVVTDPSKTSTGSYSFIARAVLVNNSSIQYKLRVPIRVMTSDQSVTKLLPGQRFSAQGRIVASKEARVAALVVIKDDINIQTQPSHWASALGAIRLGLRSLSGDGDAGALIPGMVLGDTSKQSTDFKNSMKRSGLTHLVAVSGANFALVSAFVLWMMQFLFARMKFRLTATAISLIAFIALVRPSPSVLRAAAMAAVLLIAQGTKRGRDSLPALGFAMAAVVIVDPWQARDAGFALSVLATAGLLLFAPVLIEKMRTRMPEKLAQALAPPIAAIVFCSPIIVALSGYLAPMSVIANLLAAPFVAPITIVGFIAALFSPIAPLLSTVLIWFIRFPAGAIALIAHWASSFPVLTLRTGKIGFLIVASFTLISWLLKRWFKQIIIFTLVVLISITWLQRWPGGDWQVANCDIGQGDSMVINLGNHRGLVIDVGPDPVAEDRCLKALGINEIPLLILSHFHADHVAGLPGALKNRTVGQVWVSVNSAPLVESAMAQSALKGVEMIKAVRGMSSKLGPLRIKVLWPTLSATSFAEMPGDGSQVNNSSIATLITGDAFSIFAGGDIEPPVQELLVKDVGPVDIYKVSHHGSRYQDLAFMAALHPRISIISVGAGNTYGHPAVQTLDALARLGSEVLRTDIDGAIAVQVRNHQFTVRRAKSRFNLIRWG